jgi:hypothetical protein
MIGGFGGSGTAVSNRCLNRCKPARVCVSNGNRTETVPPRAPVRGNQQPHVACTLTGIPAGSYPDDRVRRRGPARGATPTAARGPRPATRLESGASRIPTCAPRGSGPLGSRGHNIFETFSRLQLTTRIINIIRGARGCINASALGSTVRGR